MTRSPTTSKPAPKKEKLPKGFWRAPSKSLRVQVRVTGYEPVVRSFPLFKDTPAERHKQMLAATEWAARTKSNLLSGTHVSTREAESMTLGDALKAYKANGLKGKATNVAKDINRINQILEDEISKRSLASLQTTDLARYRDKLEADFWERQVKRKLALLEKSIEVGGSDAEALRNRLSRLRELMLLRRVVDDTEQDDRDREAARMRIAEIELAEDIRKPARTTLGNKIQLISRALKHTRQTINGVPTLEAIKLPNASAGRERRVSQQELDSLMKAAEGFSPLLPLLIQFAVETALRRERILEFRISYVQSIGRGQKAIVFPKEMTRRKRTGVIPITREIDRLISTARKVAVDRSQEQPLFAINPGTLDTWWKRLLKKVDIADLHFHDLRHEATSRLFERGLSTIEVMSITGHSTLEMVDRYSHYSSGIILRKMEDGLDPNNLLSEIRFLVSQFAAYGGDRKLLQAKLLEANNE